MPSDYDPNVWPPPPPRHESPPSNPRAPRTGFPPRLHDCVRYPLTTAVCMAAIATTLAWHLKVGIDWAFMDSRAWHGEPWRLVTSALPHGGPFHLLFNLAWTWALGIWLERELGTLRYAGILLLLAAGSAAADFALESGGVGLSGVGYGLCFLLWVLQKRDSRFRGAVDLGTVKLFAYWFVLCIVLTELNIWQIANVAHASGAVLGALLGVAMGARGGQRLAAWAGLGGVLALTVVGSTVARPYVNFGGGAAHEVANAALREMEAGRYDRGAKLLRQAVEQNPKMDWAWYDLAIAEARLDRTDAAIDALRKSLALDGDQPEAKRLLAQELTTKGAALHEAGDERGAEKHYREAVALDDQVAEAWYNLGSIYEERGQKVDARTAYNKAMQIDPSNKDYRDADERMAR